MRDTIATHSSQQLVLTVFLILALLTGSEPVFHLFIYLFILLQFKFHSKTRKYREFPNNPLHNTCKSPTLTAFSTRMIHLLKLWSSLLVLYILYFLDSCMIIHIHHYHGYIRIIMKDTYNHTAVQKT